MVLVRCSYSIVYFEIFIFFIVLHLKWTKSSLLSRFRYPNEYVAPPEATLLPADLPDDLYETLIQDRPDLEPVFAPYRTTKFHRPKLPYLKKKIPKADPKSPVHFEYEFKGFDKDDEEMEENAWSSNSEEDRYKNVTSRTVMYQYPSPNGTDDYGNDSTVAPFLRDIDGRRDYYFYTKKKVGRCYTCGIDKGDVPSNTLCHDMFHSQDWRMRTLARFYRTVCHYSNQHVRSNTNLEHIWKGHGTTQLFTHDRGLKKGRMDTYIPGCYKRYVDLGTGHTVRGCRHYKAERAGGLSDSRFRRLELLIIKKKNTCISSAHASLTTFSRSVSLYARYHVCVCQKRYCNRSFINKARSSLIFLVFLILELFY